MLLTSPQFKASLRIRHPSLGPDEISSRLGLTPHVSWKKGETRRTPAGSQLSGQNSDNYWCYKLPADEGSGLNEFLQSVAKTLSPNEDFLIRISDEGGTSEIYLGIDASNNAGDGIDWPTLHDLSRLRIKLSVEVFAAPQNRSSS